MSSAWIEGSVEDIKDSDKKFEDNFVTTEFQKLEDSENYLEILGKLLKFQLFLRVFKLVLLSI